MNRRWNRSFGPIDITVGPCREDRMSWFSIGPARCDDRIAGFSIGGPRQFVAVLWLPVVRAWQAGNRAAYEADRRRRLLNGETIVERTLAAQLTVDELSR